MISHSLKGFGTTTVRVQRLLLVAAGVGVLAVALYRAPGWLETWSTVAVAGVVGAAATLLVAAIALAVQGSAGVVQRVAVELVFLGLALVAVEAFLLVRAPEEWTDDQAVQQLLTRERAAQARGLAFDRRLRTEVVRELQSKGANAVPGIAQVVGANAGVAAGIANRGLLPLSNPSNSQVVECNEGNGYFRFRSDELGFNNPPGLASGPVDIAVVGESLALGHCVTPGKSAVDLVRRRFARTANFGVAGSRVLAQLGVFREYVEPLEPPIVAWFVNVNFAEAREEGDQPILVRYVDDPEFSQALRERQDEVDSFLREIVVPLTEQQDAASKKELERASHFPLDRLVTLAEVRRLVRLGLGTNRAPPPPDVSVFARAVARAVDTAREWGGRVIVVILPSYEISTGRPQDLERYEAVSDVLRSSDASIVDGAALFAAQPNALELYTLGMRNHPNERGHALLGEAIIEAIEREEVL